MVYYGTDIVESIVFHAAGDSENKHFIMMTKHANVPVFTVECCCNSEWCYHFRMNHNSDYERVKFNIMKTIFECEDVSELFAALSNMFEDGFEEILMKENKCNCDGDCERCNCEE